MSFSKCQTFDPSQDYLSHRNTGLTALFTPKTVAVVGATERAGSVGYTLVKNLINGNFSVNFRFTVFPVNPTRKTCLQLPCYPDLQSIPHPLDLVVVVTPAKTVPGIIKQCAELRALSAIIISAGFKEIGPEGIQMEQDVLENAKVWKIDEKGRKVLEHQVRIIGPNCLGVMNPHHGLNATFASKMANPGNLAFISQSGALCTAVLDWSFKEKIGFSAFVSIGSMADVNFGDLINSLGHDPNTHAILVYMETIGDARAFLSAAKEVAFTKPVIVLKAGRTQAAAAAAVSHTGSLAGSHDAFEAAMARVGVLRVNSIGELFDCALVLGKQPKPEGPRVMIITNAGGPGVLATDACCEHGVELAQLEDATLKELDKFLPSAWSHGNPLDILGDAPPDRYAQTLRVALRDPNADAVVVVLSPQDMTDCTTTAVFLADAVRDVRGEAASPLATQAGKQIPVLAAWMGGEAVAEGRQILNEAGIPVFDHPDSACKAFAKIWQRTKDLDLMYETPVGDRQIDLHLSQEAMAMRKEAKQVMLKAQKEGREVLSEYESKKVLSLFGINTVRTELAETPEEAAKQAEDIGFPVVIKLHSNTITHKSDVGGVKLNLQTATCVRKAFEEMKKTIAALPNAKEGDFLGVTVQKMENLKDLGRGAYELIIGAAEDVQFGPLVIFGSGGTLVEVFKDRCLGVPPLSLNAARRMMEGTKIFTALKGVRGAEAVDIPALEDLLVAFSEMTVCLSDLMGECDMNPVLASPKAVIALDARITVKPVGAERSKLAIRPYPEEYVDRHITLKDKKTQVIVRPLRAEDEYALRKLHQMLSSYSVRQRYLGPVSLEHRTAHSVMVKAVCADFDRHLNFGVFVEEGKDVGAMIAILRIIRSPIDASNAEIKLAVRDDFQRQGLGDYLVKKAVSVMEGESIRRLSMEILSENGGMLKLAQKYNFKLFSSEENPLITMATLNG